MKLKQRVEGQELNARAREYLVTLEAREHLLHGSLRPIIPITKQASMYGEP